MFNITKRSGGRGRRRITSLLLAAGVSMGFLLPAAPASADTASTLTVVGTSDVQDSGLIPGLITPMFEKAYPQFTLNYVSLGSGAAIAYAEAGTASALIVHAASLENQFVANGYSLEKYGRAVFWGDYVLLGPASDPAGVLSGAPHSIVQAFQDIAAAGAAGHADFVSRANTSGTAVQEHAIWALTSGTTLCTVSAANGGGDAPSTASGPCAATPSYPSWYHATGLEQGPNVEAANTCNFANAIAAGHNDCYVFTDRGTFECLLSAACRGTTGASGGAPSNLQIVTSANAATAVGGPNLLVNSFHAYALNPAKFAGDSGVSINETAAKDFLNFLTSPTFQAELASYLAPDAPFRADAAPVITASRLPRNAVANKPITVTGTVTNVVPGTPAIAGATVTVSEVTPGLPSGFPIASTRTNATGHYTLRFRAPGTGRYQITTGQIDQVENATLNPVFGDILSPAATAPSRITVHSVVTRFVATPIGGGALLSGSVSPGAGHVRGEVDVYARAGSTGAFRLVAIHKLAAGAANFALEVPLTTGPWQLEARFRDPGRLVASTSAPVAVTVAAATTTTVAIGAVHVSRGRVSLTAGFSPAAVAGSTLELLALDTKAGSSNRFKVLATVSLPVGDSAVTLRGALARHARWLLVAEYVPSTGAPATIGALRGVNVG